MLCTSCVDVELDPVAELAVREIISNLGLVVVGWYHSHPLFQPDPSVTDINNQQQYQALMKDEKSGLEPFIGLIVSTYDVKLPSVESHHQWFHTRPYSDGTRGKKPVPIPMLLETNIGIYADMNQNINLFLENDQTDDLLSKLMNLASNESAASNTVNNTNVMKCEEMEKDIKSESRKNESNTNCNTGQTGTNDRYDDVGDDNDDVDNNNNEGNFDDDNNDNDRAIKCGININKKEDTVGAAEEYSDRIMFSFHGAGGSEYLGQTDSHNNHQNIHEKIGVGADIDNGKRKYKKKAVVVPDPNASERRSGRETKAPTLFIPEKEKKIALIPTIFPIHPQDSHTTQESVAIKPSKSSQIIKIPLKKSIKTCLQNDTVVSKVPSRKKYVDKQIGSVDKWLKGGGEIIEEGPILSIKQGIHAKKATNGPASKEIIKTNQRGKGKGIQEVKSVVNILESKKRHGPGARTSKSQQKIAGKLPSTIQEEVEISQPSSSSSSSSVAGGNKKKKFNMSTWLDELERPATGTATASSSSLSSSSSVVGGKRKKIPNTSMWLDELEKPNPSPKKKDSKIRKVTAAAAGSKGSFKNLKQKINLSHIENIVNGDIRILSTALKSKINSVDVPGMKKKKNKKGVICIKEDLFCDEIIMQKVCAHTHVACVENEMISDHKSISFLSLLQGDSDAAVRGRKLICSINPTHRCLVVGIVALGFYYSTHPRRTNLNLIWRDDVLIIDKVKGSITYWASKLNVLFSCQTRLIDDISDFLIASWREGDKKIIIFPEKKEKKKRSIIDSVVSGPLHITKDGTIIRYKEDDGKDDEPKKKKKKKIFKK